MATFAEQASELGAAHAVVEARLLRWMAESLAVGIDKPDWAASRRAATRYFQRTVARELSALTSHSHSTLKEMLTSSYKQGVQVAELQLKRHRGAK
jgi:hypothetical protein